MDWLSDTATKVWVPAFGGLGRLLGTVPAVAVVGFAPAAGVDDGVGAAAAVDGLPRRSTGLSESSDAGSGADCGAWAAGVAVDAGCDDWLSSGWCNRGRSSLELPDGVGDASGVGDGELSPGGRFSLGRSSLELPESGVGDDVGFGDEGEDEEEELSPGRFRRGRPSFGLSTAAGLGSAFFATAV